MARKQKTRRPMAEINVVPYIDLPQAEAEPIEEDSKRPLVVSINSEGGFFITYDDDRTQAVDETDMLHKTAAIISMNKNIPVMVKGDRNVAYGRVVEAMVILQEAGAPSVGLITESPEN